MSINTASDMANDLDERLPDETESTQYLPLEEGTYIGRLTKIGEKFPSSYLSKKADGTEYYPEMRKFTWDIQGQDGREESEIVRIDTMSERSTLYSITKGLYGRIPKPVPLFSEMIGRYALLQLEQKLNKEGAVSGFMKIAGHMACPPGFTPAQEAPKAAANGSGTTQIVQGEAVLHPTSGQQALQEQQEQAWSTGMSATQALAILGNAANESPERIAKAAAALQGNQQATAGVDEPPF